MFSDAHDYNCECKKPDNHTCECKKPDIRDELMKMSLEDLTDFIEYSQKVMETRKRELYDKARMDFIKAYLIPHISPLKMKTRAKLKLTFMSILTSILMRHNNISICAKWRKTLLI